MSEVYKVRMTESVEFFVRTKSEQQLQEWLDTHTIREAQLEGLVISNKSYNDDILFPVDSESIEDIDIT